MSQHWKDCFSLHSYKGGMRLRVCDRWYEGPPGHTPLVKGFNIDVENDLVINEGTVEWFPKNQPPPAR